MQVKLACQQAYTTISDVCFVYMWNNAVAASESFDVRISSAVFVHQAKGQE